MAMARTTLLATGLPEHLWPEFMKASAYISNLLPHRSNNENWSPQKKVFHTLNINIEPYLKHVRTWGCRAYVHLKAGVDNKVGEKMKARATVGYLVGYEGHHGHIYRVYLPDKD